MSSWSLTKRPISPSVSERYPAAASRPWEGVQSPHAAASTAQYHEASSRYRPISAAEGSAALGYEHPAKHRGAAAPAGTVGAPPSARPLTPTAGGGAARYASSASAHADAQRYPHSATQPAAGAGYGRAQPVSPRAGYHPSASGDAGPQRGGAGATGKYHVPTLDGAAAPQSYGRAYGAATRASTPPAAGVSREQGATPRAGASGASGGWRTPTAGGSRPGTPGVGGVAQGQAEYAAARVSQEYKSYGSAAAAPPATRAGVAVAATTEAVLRGYREAKDQAHTSPWLPTNAASAPGAGTILGKVGMAEAAGNPRGDFNVPHAQAGGVRTPVRGGAGAGYAPVDRERQKPGGRDAPSTQQQGGTGAASEEWKSAEDVRVDFHSRHRASGLASPTAAPERRARDAASSADEVMESWAQERRKYQAKVAELEAEAGRAREGRATPTAARPAAAGSTSSTAFTSLTASATAAHPPRPAAPVSAPVPVGDAPAEHPEGRFAQDRVRKLESEVQSLRSMHNARVDADGKKIRDSTVTVMNLQKEMKEAKEAHQEQVRALEQDVQVLRTETAAARADLATARGEQDKHAREAEQLRAKLAQAGDASGEAVEARRREAAMEQDMETAHAEVRAMRGQMEALRQNMAAAREQLAAADRDGTQLRARVAALEAELAAAQSKGEEGASAIQERVAAAAQLGQRIEALEGELSRERHQSYQQITAARNETAAVEEQYRQRIAALEGDLRMASREVERAAQADEEAAQLRESVQEVTGREAALAARVAELESEVAHVRAEAQHRAEEDAASAAELRAHLARMESDLAQKLAEATALSEENGALLDKQGMLEAELVRVNAERAAEEAAAAELDRAYRGLQADLEAAQRRVEEAAAAASDYQRQVMVAQVQEQEALSRLDAARRDLAAAQPSTDLSGPLAQSQAAEEALRREVEALRERLAALEHTDTAGLEAENAALEAELRSSRQHADNLSAVVDQLRARSPARLGRASPPASPHPRTPGRHTPDGKALAAEVEGLRRTVAEEELRRHHLEQTLQSRDSDVACLQRDKAQLVSQVSKLLAQVVELDAQLKRFAGGDSAVPELMAEVGQLKRQLQRHASSPGGSLFGTPGRAPVTPPKAPLGGSLSSPMTPDKATPGRGREEVEGLREEVQQAQEVINGLQSELAACSNRQQELTRASEAEKSGLAEEVARLQSEVLQRDGRCREMQVRLNTELKQHHPEPAGPPPLTFSLPTALHNAMRDLLSTHAEEIVLGEGTLGLTLTDYEWKKKALRMLDEHDALLRVVAMPERDVVAVNEDAMEARDAQTAHVQALQNDVARLMDAANHHASEQRVVDKVKGDAKRQAEHVAALEGDLQAAQAAAEGLESELLRMRAAAKKEAQKLQKDAARKGEELALLQGELAEAEIAGAAGQQELQVLRQAAKKAAKEAAAREAEAAAVRADLAALEERAARDLAKFEQNTHRLEAELHAARALHLDVPDAVRAQILSDPCVHAEEHLSADGAALLALASPRSKARGAEIVTAAGYALTVQPGGGGGGDAHRPHVLAADGITHELRARLADVEAALAEAQVLARREVVPPLYVRPPPELLKATREAAAGAEEVPGPGTFKLHIPAAKDAVLALLRTEEVYMCVAVEHGRDVLVCDEVLMQSISRLRDEARALLLKAAKMEAEKGTVEDSCADLRNEIASLRALGRSPAAAHGSDSFLHLQLPPQLHRQLKVKGVKAEESTTEDGRPVLSLSDPASKCDALNILEELEANIKIMPEPTRDVLVIDTPCTTPPSMSRHESLAKDEVSELKTSELKQKAVITALESEVMSLRGELVIANTQLNHQDEELKNLSQSLTRVQSFTHQSGLGSSSALTESRQGSSKDADLYLKLPPPLQNLIKSNRELVYTEVAIEDGTLLHIADAKSKKAALTLLEQAGQVLKMVSHDEVDYLEIDDAHREMVEELAEELAHRDQQIAHLERTITELAATTPVSKPKDGLTFHKNISPVLGPMDIEPVLSPSAADSGRSDLVSPTSEITPTASTSIYLQLSSDLADKVRSSLHDVLDETALSAHEKTVPMTLRQASQEDTDELLLRSPKSKSTGLLALADTDTELVVLTKHRYEDLQNAAGAAESHSQATGIGESPDKDKDDSCADLTLDLPANLHDLFLRTDDIHAADKSAGGRKLLGISSPRSKMNGLELLERAGAQARIIGVEDGGRRILVTVDPVDVDGEGANACAEELVEVVRERLTEASRMSPSNDGSTRTFTLQMGTVEDEPDMAAECAELAKRVEALTAEMEALAALRVADAEAAVALKEQLVEAGTQACDLEDDNERLTVQVEGLAAELRMADEARLADDVTIAAMKRGLEEATRRAERLEAERARLLVQVEALSVELRLADESIVGLEARHHVDVSEQTLALSEEICTVEERLQHALARGEADRVRLETTQGRLEAARDSVAELTARLQSALSQDAGSSKSGSPGSVAERNHDRILSAMDDTIEHTSSEHGDDAAAEGLAALRAARGAEAALPGVRLLTGEADELPEQGEGNALQTLLPATPEEAEAYTGLHALAKSADGAQPLFPVDAASALDSLRGPAAEEAADDGVLRLNVAGVLRHMLRDCGGEVEATPSGVEVMCFRTPETQAAARAALDAVLSSSAQRLAPQALDGLRVFAVVDADPAPWVLHLPVMLAKSLVADPDVECEEVVDGCGYQLIKVAPAAVPAARAVLDGMLEESGLSLQAAHGLHGGGAVDTIGDASWGGEGEGGAVHFLLPPSLHGRLLGMGAGVEVLAPSGFALLKVERAAQMVHAHRAIAGQLERQPARQGGRVVFVAAAAAPAAEAPVEGSGLDLMYLLSQSTLSDVAGGAGPQDVLLHLPAALRGRVAAKVGGACEEVHTSLGLPLLRFTSPVGLLEGIRLLEDELHGSSQGLVSLPRQDGAEVFTLGDRDAPAPPPSDTLHLHLPPVCHEAVLAKLAGAAEETATSLGVPLLRLRAAAAQLAALSVVARMLRVGQELQPMAAPVDGVEVITVGDAAGGVSAPASEVGDVLVHLPDALHAAVLPRVQAAGGVEVTRDGRALLRLATPAAKLRGLAAVARAVEGTGQSLVPTDVGGVAVLAVPVGAGDGAPKTPPRSAADGGATRTPDPAPVVLGEGEGLGLVMSTEIAAASRSLRLLDQAGV